jgi:Lrp/AsnC family transcriptional regulator, leucine-responsive regulatory protein
MAIRLDKLDRALLSELYANSRANFASVGRKIRLSGASVERRFTQLVKGGVIGLFFADVNMYKIGLRSYRIYYRMDSMDGKMEREVMDFMCAHPHTLWAVLCEGAYDVVWRIAVPGELDVERAMSEFGRRFGDSIVKKTVITTTHQYYLSWTRAFGGERGKHFPKEELSQAEKVDEADGAILHALYSDSRMSTATLAQMTGLVPEAVAYRIRRLEKKGYIMGYTAWFNPRALGKDYHKLLISFRNAKKEDEERFSRYCAENGSVVFINKTIGSWDMEVDILVDNNTQLHEFTRDLRTKFSGILGSYEYISVIEDRMCNPISL